MLGEQVFLFAEPFRGPLEVPFSIMTFQMDVHTVLLGNHLSTKGVHSSILPSPALPTALIRVIERPPQGWEPRRAIGLSAQCTQGTMTPQTGDPLPSHLHGLPLLEDDTNIFLLSSSSSFF